MFDSDTLGLIITHIRCTKTLLNLRATCKAARDEIGIERIAGMPMDTLRILVCPDRRLTMGRCQNVWPDDIGACFTDNGKEFWTWANTTCGKVVVDQYAVVGNEWKAISTYEANVPSATYLWLHVTDGGMICTLSVIDDALPIVFSAFRCEDTHAVLQTEFDNSLLLTLHTELDRSLLLENESEEEFAPVIYRFHQDNVLFASWNGRSYLAVMPNSHKLLGLLQIKQEGVWVWWELHQVHAMCQAGSKLFAMPGQGQMLFALDLDTDEPEPALVDTLPRLPMTVTKMEV